MGGAIRKSVQRPTHNFKNISKDDHMVSLSASTEDTTLHCLHRRPQRNEAKSSENEQRKEHNESYKIHNVIQNAEYTTRPAIRRPDCIKVLSKSGSTDQLNGAVETKFNRKNVRFSDCENSKKMLSGCPIYNVLDSSSICQQDQPATKESTANIGPKCTTPYVIETSTSKQNPLVTNHKNNMKLLSKGVSSNVLNADLNRLRVRPVHQKSNKKKLPRYVPFRDLSNNPRQHLVKPFSSKSSMKVVSRSVSPNVLSATCSQHSQPVNDKSSLTRVPGCVSSGGIQSRTSYQRSNQPRPHISRLKLNNKSSAWVIERKSSLRNDVRTNREAQERIRYYRTSLDSITLLPDWACPGFLESRYRRNVPHPGMVKASVLETIPNKKSFPRTNSKPMYKRHWHKQFRRSMSNPDTRIPHRLASSSTISKSSCSRVLKPNRKTNALSSKSRSRSSLPDPVFSQNDEDTSQFDMSVGTSADGTQSSIVENYEKDDTKDKAVLSNEGTSIVVEMDDSGYTIRRPLCKGSVEVRALGRDWRIPSVVPVSLMADVIKQKLDWERNERRKKRDEKLQNKEHYTKRHRKDHKQNHEETYKDSYGGDQRESRKRGHKEVYMDNHKENLKVGQNKSHKGQNVLGEGHSDHRADHGDRRYHRECDEGYREEHCGYRDHRECHSGHRDHRNRHRKGHTCDRDHEEDFREYERGHKRGHRRHKEHHGERRREYRDGHRERHRKYQGDDRSESHKENHGVGHGEGQWDTRNAIGKNTNAVRTSLQNG